MSEKVKKIIVLEVVVLATLLILWGIGQQVGDTSSVTATKSNLSVTFFDVLKGDCILIQTSDDAVMIDTGYEENGEEIVQWLKELGVNSLQYLILTHPDKDHIGGADHIISQLKVAQIIETDCEVDSGDYKEYKAAAIEKGVDILTLKETKEIELGKTKIVVYPPVKVENYEGENNFSLVTKLTYGETSMLFAGDAQELRMNEILTQIPDIKSTLLKVPHHGSYMNNSEEFFRAVSPQYSIITNDKKKMYKDIKKMLKNLGRIVYETKNGDIHVISDGKKLLISQ